MYYTVYKTTNLINQEYYIGVHATKKPNDNYLGSGLILKRSVEKYGKHSFKKEILHIFEEKQHAFEKEKEILSEQLSNHLCMNIAKGGCGGSNFKGKHHSEETKNRLSTYKGEKNSFFGKQHSENTIEHIKQTRYNKNNGKYFAAETIEKIRLKSQQRFLQNFEKEKQAKIAHLYWTEDKKKEHSLKMKEYYRNLAR